MSSINNKPSVSIVRFNCDDKIHDKQGIQPGIGKGDRKRRLQGFEVLMAKVDAKTYASGTTTTTTTLTATGDNDQTTYASTNSDNNLTLDANDPSVAAAISAHRGREAARDKRPRGGLAPSLVGLLWEHQLPAALAAGVAAAAAALARSGGDAAVEGVGGGSAGGVGGEGPASSAAALVFAAVRQVLTCS